MRLQPAKHRQRPRTRALFKVAILVVLVNQLLTTTFALLAYRNHPDIALGLTILFSFASCVILSVWVRSDARHAWLHAREAGYLSSTYIRSGRMVWVSEDCPKRWLVVLHIEFEGGVAASANETLAGRTASET